ncbi:MAG: hypothetical protein Q9168_006451 [Polycauliona sp. 1 TL-2023]
MAEAPRRRKDFAAQPPPSETLMAKHHTQHHQPAAADAASAPRLHDVAANNATLHKSASTQLTLTNEAPIHSREARPTDTSSTSSYPPESAEPPSSSPSPLIALAGQSELLAKGRAHQAALSRLNAQDFHSRTRSRLPDSESVASTQPVVVKEYPQGLPFSSSAKQAKMKSMKRSSGYRSSEIPPLESFSFQDILASIDPDVALSIDRIAEICGRSKMSMADEYSSHMPPQSDFIIAPLQGNSNEAAVSRLAPVEEASSTHEEALIDGPSSQRSKIPRLSLVNPVVVHGDLSSTPITATSVVASHTQSGGVPEQVRDSGNRESHVGQLFAWLRTSRNSDARSGKTARRDSGAANALQQILESSTERAMR